MRRLLIPVLVSVAVLMLTALPAGAAERGATDPQGDVPFGRGDLVSWRALHGSTNVDLRVRTARGGDPVHTWPNLVTRIKWRIDTQFGNSGPEFFAELYIDQGEDTVFLARVVQIERNVLRCEAQQFVPDTSTVSNDGNLYRFRFPRTCIGNPAQFRARASFLWDPGMAGGPVHTDFAPNGGPSGQIASG